jgi:group I intron endonuclease
VISRIYKITNTLTQQSYIGYTSKTVEERWSKHKAQLGCKKNSGSLFYRRIREFGIDAFDVEELYASKDITHCHLVMEDYFISKYDTMCPNGYNSMPGGKSTPNKRTIRQNAQSIAVPIQ